MSNKIKPTSSELEILQIIWTKGKCTVREVHDELEKEKETGYTTTLKLMQIMLEKGLLTRDETARTHIYAAAISQKASQKQAVTKMIETMFMGSPAKLIMHALGNYKASEQELATIKDYLQNIETKNSKL